MRPLWNVYCQKKEEAGTQTSAPSLPQNLFSFPCSLPSPNCHLVPLHLPPSSFLLAHILTSARLCFFYTFFPLLVCLTFTFSHFFMSSKLSNPDSPSSTSSHLVLIHAPVHFAFCFSPLLLLHAFPSHAPCLQLLVLLSSFSLASIFLPLLLLVLVVFHLQNLSLVIHVLL